MSHALSKSPMHLVVLMLVAAIAFAGCGKRNEPSTHDGVPALNGISKR